MPFVNLSRSMQAILKSYLPGQKRIRQGEEPLDIESIKKAFEELAAPDLKPDDEKFLNKLIETLKLLEPLTDISDKALSNVFEAEMKKNTDQSMDWTSLKNAKSTRAIQKFLKDKIGKIIASSLKIEGPNTATVNFAGTRDRSHAMKINLLSKDINFGGSDTARQYETQTKFADLDKSVQERLSALHRIANNQMAVSKLLAT